MLFISPDECPNHPIAPVNGGVTSGSRKIGTRRTYTCIAGYEVRGPASTECTRQLTWSPQNPRTCVGETVFWLAPSWKYLTR